MFIYRLSATYLYKNPILVIKLLFNEIYHFDILAVLFFVGDNSIDNSIDNSNQLYFL